jgi:SAM-dependent methyltransferase
MSGSEHWGQRPRDWAELAEPSNHVLFTTVLAALELVPGAKLLDIGCGSGYALRLAAQQGATVTGLDLTPELLAIAAERVPEATLVEDGMDRLPFVAERFDAAVGFNAFQFADDPAAAVREATRVVQIGGHVAATTFAEPERNESTALHLALEPLRGSAPQSGHHLPYGLSAPGGLERLLSDAGLEVTQSGEVPVVWAHPSAELAVRAILASGGGAMAIAAAGEAAAAQALVDGVKPFTLADGRVEMHNVFRFAIGTKRR